MPRYTAATVFSFGLSIVIWSGVTTICASRWLICTVVIFEAKTAQRPMPLTEKHLRTRDAKRDLGAELLVSIREMKAG